MSTNKTKGRGSGTGRGSSKKQRGKGNRGGVGKTGLGKKSKHKKMSVEGTYLGEHGFTRPQELVEDTEVINLRDIDQHIERFVEQGYAEQDGQQYVFDAEAAGFGKVLGTGDLTRDIDIKAPAFSAGAREKIEDGGNDAIVTE